MIDEGFVEDQAGLGLGLVPPSGAAASSRTAALLPELAASWPPGAHAGLWGGALGRALAGERDDEEMAKRRPSAGDRPGRRTGRVV